MKQKITIRQLYDNLFESLGPQNWWGANSTEEMLVSMILIQNTNSQNVMQSIKNLRAATDNNMIKILEFSDDKLQELIKPSGFFKNKSQYVRAVLNMYQNDFDELQKLTTDELRKELLKIKGVGNETADVILLYLFHRKTFVADTYAIRLFSAISGQKFTYASLRKLVMDNLEFSEKEAEEFHALIDEVGKNKEMATRIYESNQLII